jgi:hypothetical protein
MGQLLGALGSAAIKYYSDRRLKENITPAGYDIRTGLNLYEFNYIGTPGTRYRGVMADEVLDYDPEAVVTDSQGYFAVNYGRLGIAFEEVPQ